MRSRGLLLYCGNLRAQRSFAKVVIVTVDAVMSIIVNIIYDILIMLPICVDAFYRSVVVSRVELAVGSQVSVHSHYLLRIPTDTLDVLHALLRES